MRAAVFVGRSATVSVRPTRSTVIGEPEQAVAPARTLGKVEPVEQDIGLHQRRSVPAHGRGGRRPSRNQSR